MARAPAAREFFVGGNAMTTMTLQLGTAPPLPLSDEEALAVETLVGKIAPLLEHLPLPAGAEVVARLLAQHASWAGLAGSDGNGVIEDVLNRAMAYEKAVGETELAMMPHSAADERAAARLRGILEKPGARPVDAR
jgi:hypothetical protein